MTVANKNKHIGSSLDDFLRERGEDLEKMQDEAIERLGLCKHCGGQISIRNPSGDCDHLYWPDNLTDEAKRENGFVPKQVTIWTK